MNAQGTRRGGSPVPAEPAADLAEGSKAPRRRPSRAMLAAIAFAGHTPGLKLRSREGVEVRYDGEDAWMIETVAKTSNDTAHRSARCPHGGLVAGGAV